MTTERQDVSHRACTVRTVGRLVVGSLFLLTLGGASARAEEGQPLISIPAELVTTLGLPGAEDHLLRPSAVFVDETFGEILVADAGNNRVVIFDDEGSYRYQFAGRNRFSMPLDLVVDEEGYILVLASTIDGRRVLRYDFDGTFLDEVVLAAPAGDPLVPRTLDLAPDGSLLILDATQPRVCSYAESGDVLGSFELADGLGRPIPAREVIGHPRARAGLVFVPLPARGTVYVFDMEGTFIRAIGHQGTNITELSFPVDVALTGEGILMVLDKHRFNVVCFDLEGRFQGEFGGQGARPGWYYHPTLLSVDADDRVFIGQVFQNRVDVCRFPTRIRDRYLGRQQEIVGGIDENPVAGPLVGPG